MFLEVVDVLIWRLLLSIPGHYGLKYVVCLNRVCYQTLGIKSYRFLTYLRNRKVVDDVFALFSLDEVSWLLQSARSST